MKRKIVSVFLSGLFWVGMARAQHIKIPSLTHTEHPRLLTDAKTGKARLATLISREDWAKTTYEKITAEVSPYVDRHQQDSTWMVSRLQMYWNTHSTDVFIKNGAYAYATGKAPVPTVRFTGTRDVASQYMRPKLEDIKPYMDQDGKVYFQSKGSGQDWEWVDQSKTGRSIESINIEIINKARDAAMIYWHTGSEKYGKFAYDLFNTYMTGMYYRNEPIDLNKGHDQTLVGLSSFEVIHEDMLEPLTACYDFLHGYIQKKHPKQLPLYAETFKRWADIVIKNGVPFNNWNLIEARFVACIALILENDQVYPDKKGCGYYLDQILNQTHTRQWALTDILKKGYDPKTGIWAESPGYSVNVLADFTGFVNFFDRTMKMDLLPELPVLSQAVSAQPQYLFPNGSIVGFGDTHYGPIRMEPMEDLIRNARLHGKKQQELYYTRLLKTMQNLRQKEESGLPKLRTGFMSLFSNPPLTLSESVATGLPEDYMTATFWAPNVAWMVQRNGIDPHHGLMISQAGSGGNHAHANGIAMELYGKGLILAPEGGIGGSYFQSDYAEYYSQFPAHNTVVVDGISSYPTMKSNHFLKLQGAYPEPGIKQGYFKDVTYSNLLFLEPETNSNQNRLMSIVRTSDSSGYYVDVFRSAKKNGGDKYHDYIYHNLGQRLSLTDALKKPLPLKATDKLTFANEELMGYDYWYDKQSVVSSGDFNGRFELDIPGRAGVYMNMWMKGYPDREIFSVKAPPSKSWRKDQLIPDSIANLPLPTVVVRQNGAAWERPFVAVYEPAEGNTGGDIARISSFAGVGNDSSFAGIQVESKNGMIDYIFAGAAAESIKYQDMQFKGTYGMVRAKADGLVFLFLTDGNELSKSGYGLFAGKSASAVLSFKDKQAFFSSSAEINLTLPDVYLSDKEVSISFTIEGKLKRIIGNRLENNGTKVVSFMMPALNLTEIAIKQ